MLPSTLNMIDTDYVLPLAEIPETLVRLAKNLLDKKTISNETRKREPKLVCV